MATVCLPAAPYSRCNSALARVAELLRVDLANVTEAAERVAPYITADGRRLWSVKLIERAIDPSAPAWLRRRSGAAPNTPPTLAG
jgi:hypothetical protein